MEWLQLSAVLLLLSATMEVMPPHPRVRSTASYRMLRRRHSQPQIPLLGLVLPAVAFKLPREGQRIASESGRSDAST